MYACVCEGDVYVYVIICMCEGVVCMYTCVYEGLCMYMYVCEGVVCMYVCVCVCVCVRGWCGWVYMKHLYLTGIQSK